MLAVVYGVHHIVWEDRCIYFEEWSNNFLYFLQGISGNVLSTCDQSRLNKKTDKRSPFLKPVPLSSWPHAVLFHLCFHSLELCLKSDYQVLIIHYHCDKYFIIWQLQVREPLPPWPGPRIKYNEPKCKKKKGALLYHDVSCFISSVCHYLTTPSDTRVMFVSPKWLSPWCWNIFNFVV